jgi:hypothetical protein
MALKLYLHLVQLTDHSLSSQISHSLGTQCFVHARSCTKVVRQIDSVCNQQLQSSFPSRVQPHPVPINPLSSLCTLARAEGRNDSA